MTGQCGHQPSAVGRYVESLDVVKWRNDSEHLSTLKLRDAKTYVWRISEQQYWQVVARRKFAQDPLTEGVIPYRSHQIVRIVLGYALENEPG